MGIVAKYKYDGSVYADLLPEFNAEFTNYTVTDEVEGNIITRTIESESLPTLMRFGVEGDNHTDNSRQDSLLEILEMDTSALTTCKRMFGYCKNLTNIECVWDTSNVDNMLDMFAHCQSLTKLDLSSFDTSDVVNMQGVFYNCQSLTKLDLSSFDTSNVVTMYSMISECYNLTSLDVSNFNTSNVTDMVYMLKNAFLLTDIGMIYCDQSTINKVASLLPTDRNITIWVESDDILQYDQYDHITYKTQKVQDTVHLNSPLLMGDTIEVIDGKTYHVHRMGKVVLDGSKSFNISVTEPEYVRFFSSLKHLGISNAKGNASLLCNNFINVPYITLEQRLCEGIGIKKDAVDLGINILKYRLSELTANGFKQWLQENPTTVIYELKEPYYELISEEPLELTLLDTTDNTINNNSILPSNMSIANKELSTIAIKPSTIYTLSFDKSNKDSEVTIDICGGEQITTVLNRIELTTPSELGSGIRFISSDGCIISNVRLLEGSLVEGAIPKETFEGLQSSFDEGYLIGENIIGELYNLHDWKEVGNNYVANTTKNTIRQSNLFISLPKKLKNNQQYTVFVKMTDYTQGLCFVSLRNNDNTVLLSAECSIGSVGMHSLLFTTTGEASGIRFLTEAQKDNSYAINKDIIILEGDHTHLSEAELMRYIEKGTSHYEEEDYNHVGKYKVQYKVTGKNKFNKDANYKKDDSVIFNVNETGFDFIRGDRSSYDYIIFDIKMPFGMYTIKYLDSSLKGLHWDFIDIDGNTIHTQNNRGSFELNNDCYKIKFYTEGIGETHSITNLQIEEGTVATEYEPYKEDIKTYYLSSPLLEGDTIEDINGVATHVKRYGQVVLDGSQYLTYYGKTNDNSWSFVEYRNDNMKLASSIINDRFPQANVTLNNNLLGMSGVQQHPAFRLRLTENDSLASVNAYLQENPVTVVYQLASPIYEKISDESILCDSYTNGHLDFDTNVPIEKIEFIPTSLVLAYLQPSTSYTVQFESDNVGEILFGIGGTDFGKYIVHKGLNKFYGITNSSLTNDRLWMSGIGFNASNIQVVEANEDIEFDYFKGLQSSFEDGLVTDENDENYGKYKVECKIVGKNKFDKTKVVKGLLAATGEGIYVYNDVFKDDSYYASECIPVKKGVNYILNDKLGWYHGFFLNEDDERGLRFDYPFTPPSNGFIRTSVRVSDIDNVQLEEGTQATSYEPYKESIHTLYLNSPLLKGDKLVVHDGKLCHYHKMGMVVLDGNSTMLFRSMMDSVISFRFKLPDDARCTSNPSGIDKGYTFISNRLPSVDSATKYGILDGTALHTYNEELLKVGYISLLHEYITNDISNITWLVAQTNAKQWLQANPTTVVYELAEPYYEPIEPQLSQYSFSTVKDGDMEIITVLPIEKINLTYRTDINGVSSIEEQIASIQEGTDISSIIDEEVDE